MSKVKRITALFSCFLMLTANSCQFVPKAFADDAQIELAIDEAYILERLEALQGQIDTIGAALTELIAALAEQQKETLEALQGIQSAVIVLLIAVGLIAGMFVVKVFSGGMRNAS